MKTKYICISYHITITHQNSSVEENRETSESKHMSLELIPEPAGRAHQAYQVRPYSKEPTLANARDI